MRNSRAALFLVAGVVIGLCAGVGVSKLGAPEPEAKPASAPGELVGLWEVVSVRNLTKGEDQPHRREFHMFGPTHQMVVLAGEGRPRLDKSFSDMTPEEILSQQPVGAGFYRYEAADGKIVRTNIAALSAYYEGRSFEGRYEVSGTTLALRDSHSADGHEREWTMRRVE